jgi:20S proteasome alpha/beta subunit
MCVRTFDEVSRDFSFLGYVDLLGTTYSAPTLATGYGAYIAQPLLRKSVEGREDTLTEEEAMKILEGCMKVLFYRDARSLNKVCFLMFVPSLLVPLLTMGGPRYYSTKLRL